MTKLRCMLCCLMICTITIDARTVNDIYKRISAQVSLKVPGNQSRNYSLAFQGAVDDKGIYLLESEEKIPLIITERIERDNVKCVMVVSITALEDVYFNYQQQLKTGFRHNDCMFYLPGFWYIRNSRDIYALTEWLQNALLKKVNRGLTPSVEYLANCSTMKKIVRMAAKMLSDQDHKTATKQEKEQAAREHAAYIIGCVEYLSKF